ncbi:MAG: TIR domain-containing protein [Planctomycetes bacterium]|nr:TIR domain-containing protein [Planctomycetota bacterium]
MASKRRKRVEPVQPPAGRSSAPPALPDGVRLRAALANPGQLVTKFAWSPDGKSIAAPDKDASVRIWDPASGRPASKLQERRWVNAVAWSRDGTKLVAASDGELSLWDVLSQTRLWSAAVDCGYGVCWSLLEDELFVATLNERHRVAADGKKIDEFVGRSTAVATSPAAGRVAYAMYDDSVALGHGNSTRLAGHGARVWTIRWASEEQLISASGDATIRVWDVARGVASRVLEGHTKDVLSISISPCGRILASKSMDGTVRLWRLDFGDCLCVVPQATGFWSNSLAFHPVEPLLASYDAEANAIAIWEVDIDRLLGIETTSHSYANAKIVLVGDSGVGKTGLGLVLTGQDFAPTDSTHGRHVWTLAETDVPTDTGDEHREVLLWDLAGQPGYRLVHQLHLGDVAVALVVCDARSDSDPLAGVRHWDRALRQARRVRADGRPVPRCLVIARTDRGGLPVSPERLQAFADELGFDACFETSAKEGWGIAELRDHLLAAIPWHELPKVTSNELFQSIKQFLLGEKKSGRLLSKPDDLYRAFVQAGNAETAELRAQFDTCIGRIEARDLIRRLSFGDFVLLQPELLDAYASAMVHAARDEPDGLGFLVEDDALAGRFRMARHERVQDAETERLLRIATVEELFRHEIVLREPSNEGNVIVFPSELTREYPDAPDPEGKAAVFTFEGPVQSVYATLVVRLTRSGLMQKSEKWRNATLFHAAVGGTCGLWLREVAEGRAELTLFYGEGASDETRRQFESFVARHLERRALPDTIAIRRVRSCQDCHTPVTDRQVRLRRERGFDFIDCNVCGSRIDLASADVPAAASEAVATMDREADRGRALEANVATLAGKRATNDFDVFISYSSKDRAFVVDWLVPRLERHAILPCLDIVDFDVGKAALDNMEQAVKACPKTLLVLTPNWLASEWAGFEGLLVQKKDPAGVRQRVVPLLLEPCELPDRLDVLTFADLTDAATRETQLERVIDAILGRTRLGQPR